jgi:hypothetical protein
MGNVSDGENENKQDHAKKKKLSNKLERFKIIVHKVISSGLLKKVKEIQENLGEA